MSLISLAGNLQNVLAAANEEGIVRIYNTQSQDNPLLKGTCCEVFIHNCLVQYQGIWQAKLSVNFTEWLAHENAVFDIAWVPGESQLVRTSHVKLLKTASFL